MKRPNILILYTDQQRWDALGANGNSRIKTPNLDRLASEGFNFDHHFVQNPVCMPSRLSFLSGMYPSANRITHMGVPVPEDIAIAPHYLRNHGYVSANIGKLHFLPHSARDHREIHPPYGFDHLEISDEPGCYEDAYRAWVRATAPDQLDFVSLGLPPAAEIHRRFLKFDDGIEHPGERFPKRPLASRCRSDVTHTAFVAEQTIEFMSKKRAEPFFCVAGFYSPHSPWVAPQEFIDLYDPAEMTIPDFPPEIESQRSADPADRFSDDELRLARQGYYAMISEVDHHVGRILERLEAEGLAEDTIVVFTSDHGEWLGEHLRYGKGHPGCDCVSRVPLIVRWPAAYGRSGRVRGGIVEAVDVLPTLLECAGVPIPPHLQGRSLKPIFDGRSESVRDAALMEADRWKSIRTNRYRYVCNADASEILYDLREDPGEYRNAASDPQYAQALSDMRRRLLSAVIEAERPLPRPAPY